jgi:hypothetical protein
VDADPDGEPLLGAGLEPSDRLHDPQPGPDGSVGVVFVGLRVAEVDEQPVAEVLGDVVVKAGDHLGAGGLVGAHHLAEFLRVEASGQGGRTDQVAEHHGKLATLSLRDQGRPALGGDRGSFRCRLGRLTALPAELRRGRQRSAALGAGLARQGPAALLAELRRSGILVLTPGAPHPSCLRHRWDGE